MPNVIEKVIARFTGDGKVPDNAKDPIPTGASNLTIGSAFVAALALVVDQFTGWSNKLLGENAGSGAKAALAIAIIGAAAVVFAADLLARGYASAHTTPSPGEPAAPVANVSASGVTVSIPALPSEDEHGWTVIRAQGDNLLLIKKDKPPQWRSIHEVRGE